MQDDLDNPADQSEVIRFLSKGAGLGPAAERIDTHGALVFLVGDRALKIKRAVKYDYMDLSTLEKRHALLEREFELNHVTAPTVYRKVIPLVRKADGTLALGGPGDVVEWVLSMNRFPRAAELTHIAEDQGIDDALAQELGLAIKRYHHAAPFRDAAAETLIAEILDELERVLTTMTDRLGPGVGRFLQAAREAVADNRQTLQSRSELGHVRRCHGDLHLRNIVVLDGVPTPFDALEFDERLGTCDTLYDLAFLLMDLLHRDMDHQANLVLNAYLQQSSLVDAGLCLLPLYFSVRSAIRAMVDVQTSDVMDHDASMETEARAYLAEANGYLDPAAPVLLAIGGYSGSGKTTIARALAHRIGPAPGAIHIRSDIVRKQLLKRDQFQALGPGGYAPEVSARTYGEIRQRAEAVLKQRHAVILDAVHGEETDREAARKLAAHSGCAFVGVWLEAPVQTRATRVSARGPDASDADVQLVMRQERADPGPIDWHRMSSDRPMEEIVDQIVELSQRGRAQDTQTKGGRHVG